MIFLMPMHKIPPIHNQAALPEIFVYFQVRTAAVYFNFLHRSDNDNDQN